MIYAEFYTSKECILPGVGKMSANQVVILDELGISRFQRIHKVKIGSARLPNHIDFSIIVEGGE